MLAIAEGVPVIGYEPLPEPAAILILDDEILSADTKLVNPHPPMP
jgi:hypothetical protein